MKYLKFQQDLMKARDAKERKGKAFRYFWCKNGNDICVSPEGHYIIVIWKDMFFLDTEKVFGTMQTESIKKFLDAENLMPAEDMKATIVSDKLKIKMHKFKVNDQDVFINEENLKYFDLKNSTFKGNNSKSPIYIYENTNISRLVGVVLPINHVED